MISAHTSPADLAARILQPLARSLEEARQHLDLHRDPGWLRDYAVMMVVSVLYGEYPRLGAVRAAEAAVRGLAEATQHKRPRDDDSDSDARQRRSS